MNALSPASPCELFSHLYIESSVLDHPETRRIRARFARSKVIEIPHYKDMFNRPNQSFHAQSRSKNLILARRNPPFFYEGSFYSDGFAFEQFFYTPTMLGCLYDCDYCYLQGLYPSANTVLFVNLEEYFDALKPLLNAPTLLAISYDTDTLAVEKITGHAKAWIDFAHSEPNLHLEIRTKSANFSALSNTTPHEKVVLAWTLSPQTIIDRYEHRTPSLHARLQAAASAMAAGWRVRLCVDPVIHTDAFEQIYPALIETIFDTIDASALFSLTLGSFRMSSTHLKRLKKRQSSDIAFYPYQVKDQIATYDTATEHHILDTLLASATKYLPRKKIRTWELPKST